MEPRQQYDDYIGSNFDSFIQSNPPNEPSGKLASLSSATNFVTSLVQDLAGMFGKGRREADRITGFQNELINTPNSVLTIAVNLANDPDHQNVEDLNEIYQLSANAVHAFFDYIGYPTYPKNVWPDGRASRQAYAAVNGPPNFLCDGILSGLRNKLIAAGGRPHPIEGISNSGRVGSIGADISRLGSLGQNSFAGGIPGGSSGLLIAGAVVAVVAVFAFKGGKA